MSDFYNKYPYTDFHELNLDWVIERVKKLTEDWLATQEAWNNTQEQWQQLHDYVMDYFANLDVQDEINNKINQMILDGTFLSIVASTINQTVVDTTTSWLAAHITQPTTPAIDNTLLIAGAAADAKSVGDKLFPTMSSLSQDERFIITDLSVMQSNIFTTAGGESNKLIYYENGNEYTNSNYFSSDFLSIDSNSLYRCTSINTHVCLYDSNEVFINGYLIATDTEKIIHTGNASFVRLSVPNNGVPTCTFGKLISPVNPSDITQLQSDVSDIITNGRMIDDSILTEVNLFDPADATPGVLYYYETGATVSNANYMSSDFIACNNNEIISITATNTHVCFWDSNRTFLFGKLITTLGRYAYNTKNASYVTISIPNNISTSAIIGTASLQHRFYMPYQPGYIYHTFDIPADRLISGNTNKNTACLKLPTSYRPSGAPTKLCIIAHGASGGISPNTGWTLSNEYNNIVNALLAAGYAVMDSNGYNDNAALGYNHWGCPQALAGYYIAWNYFTTTYNLKHDVYVYGFSMGGLTALSLIKQHTIPIRAGMIMCPVVSLYQHCVVQNGGVARQDFLDAYQTTDYIFSDVRGYDRYPDIRTINGNDFVFDMNTPLYVGYGLQDTAVSNTHINDYTLAIANTNSNVVLKAYNGDHSISYGSDPDVYKDMLRWFARY